jgi:PIN domain nuclease of toxin-antitoxin system
VGVRGVGMGYLLDTHVVLWLLAKPDLVPATVRDELAPGNVRLLVSAVSAMEVATKSRLGKLDGAVLVATWGARMAELAAEALPLAAEHALLAGSMAWDHRDPFDRMLVAQALVEGLTLVTADPAVRGVTGLRTLAW